MRRIGERNTLLLLVAGLIALGLLAALQASWLAQVGAGERARRQAALDVGAQRFAEEFDRELARAYLTFQLDAEALRTRDWQRFAQRYDRWQQTAPYPAMVAEVLLVEVNQIGRVRLLRYRAAERRFEPTPWAIDLLPLRGRFEQTYRDLFAANVGQRRPSVPPVDTAPPSLLVPIERPWLLSDQQELGIDADLIFSDQIFPGAITHCRSCPAEIYEAPLFAHTIVVLNTGYLQQTLFPTLIARHFPADGEADYQVAVLDPAAPEGLRYRSLPTLTPADFAAADASAGLFAVSYDDLNRMLLTGDPRSEADGEGGRVTIGVLGRPEESPATRGAWRLALRHRAGSLAAAVDGMLLRNGAISTGTLLLLGGSMLMLVLSTRRAQRLARRQIEFASAVSHELRTPLTVIRAAGENLADGVVADPAQARRYGALIADEGRRLSEMVEHVLAFASDRAGGPPPQRAPLAVADLVAETLHALQHELRAGGYTVELDLPADLPPLPGDAAALRRALQNLLANALKYGGADRWVGLAVQPSRAGDALEISVSDHGGGVAPADMPLIFEPFYRGRRAIAAQIPGSGLGLSLVQSTVAAHGGRVTVDAPPGGGARFTMHLPLAAAPTAPAPTPLLGEL